MGVGGRSATRPSRLYPGKDPVSIVKEAGWAPGPVRTGAENLALTGILSLDRPARRVTIRTTLPGLTSSVYSRIFSFYFAITFHTGIFRNT
jgi:hypothetical protein